MKRPRIQMEIDAKINRVSMENKMNVVSKQVSIDSTDDLDIPKVIK